MPGPSPNPDEAERTLVQSGTQPFNPAQQYIVSRLLNSVGALPSNMHIYQLDNATADRLSQTPIPYGQGSYGGYYSRAGRFSDLANLSSWRNDAVPTVVLGNSHSPRAYAHEVGHAADSELQRRSWVNSDSLGSVVYDKVKEQFANTQGNEYRNTRVQEFIAEAFADYFMSLLEPGALGSSKRNTAQDTINLMSNMQITPTSTPLETYMRMLMSGGGY